MQKKKSFLVWLIPVTLLLGSCGTSADIKAAQDLAKLRDEAITIFPNIANDVYQSCRRTAELTLLNTPTVNSGEIDRDRKEARKTCQGNPISASQALNNTNNLILNYLAALGKLATDELTNYDQEIDAIGASVQNLPGLNTEERKEAVDAGTAIAKFLFRIATEAYRREQLKNVVVETDSHLQTLVTALDKAVKQGYINGVLENEQTAVDNYYRSYLGRVLTAPQGESVSAQISTEQALDREWKNANSELETKKDLAKLYLGLLNKIAADHHNLRAMYVKGEEPSPTQVKQMIDGYTKDLKSLTEKSEKLFQKNEL